MNKTHIYIKNIQLFCKYISFFHIKRLILNRGSNRLSRSSRKSRVSTPSVSENSNRTTVTVVVPWSNCFLWWAFFGSSDDHLCLILKLLKKIVGMKKGLFFWGGWKLGRPHVGPILHWERCLFFSNKGAIGVFSHRWPGFRSFFGLDPILFKGKRDHGLTASEQAWLTFFLSGKRSAQYFGNRHFPSVWARD